MNNDQQNKSVAQTQPATQKLNDQQQTQGAQQVQKPDATKPEAAKAPEAAAPKSPAAEVAKS